MRIAIIQSCYIPWKGFFDLIGRCDQYVVYDSVQFVKRHWHNRNRIKTANGVQWLTIPVLTKGKFDQPIHSVEIERPWAEQHWRAIELAYRRAPFFDLYSNVLKGCYERASEQRILTDVNMTFLKAICELLELKTRFRMDTEFELSGSKTDRLLGIAKDAGADHYLSGPSARSYLDENMFAQAGIKTKWMDYQGYPTYPQLHGAFEEAVSIVDLLFQTGPDARRYIEQSSNQ